MAISTGFLDSDGNDASTGLVPKSYLLERYPEMAATYKSSGLWAWGNNYWGQLGYDASIGVSGSPQSSPVLVGGSTSTWKTLVSSSGDFSTLNKGAIKTDGTLWLWGDNSSGQLGNNNRTSASSPVQTVSGGTNWKQACTINGWTAAIKTDGSLWTWGQNQYGQLGSNSIASRSSPGQTVSGGTTWRQVSIGSANCSAIKTDGTLWTWGLNDSAQLGTGTYTYRSSPGQIAGGGTTWRQVSGTAAIKTDGTLWTWGTAPYLWTYLTPVQMGSDTNWKQVLDNSYDLRVAIKTDGTLWTWGENYHGALGTGDRTSTISPVQTVAGGTDWHSIKGVGGILNHVLAMKTDGSVWKWGYNGMNNAGFGAEGVVTTPRQLIYGGKNYKDVDGNYSFSAIKDDSEDLL